MAVPAVFDDLKTEDFPQMSISIPKNRLDIPPTVRDYARPPLDGRRWIQLALAAIWLLDGILQYQPYMFTKAFATQVLATTAPGNPGWIADPITWAARIAADHPVGSNTGFATIQLLLGLGIAWRPTVKAALAASVGWSVAVWWLGEGLGGVLTGTASPLNGAPGAVILYALLAVLIWPVEREDGPAKGDSSNDGSSNDGPFLAARPVGAAVARGLWFVLWGSLVFFTMQSANTGSQDVHDMITDMAQGQPRWLTAINNHAADLVAHHGMAASIVMSVVLGVIAIGVFLPARIMRATLVLALVMTAVIWLVGEDLGALFTGGQGTDPNSGPLLALLALAYWPTVGRSGSADRRTDRSTDRAVIRTGVQTGDQPADEPREVTAT
jgi:hypothetical protein